MNHQIGAYIETIFAPYDGAKSVAELKGELLADLNERFAELTCQGKTEEAALAETLESIGDIEETLGEMANLTRDLERRVQIRLTAQDLTGSDFAGVTLHGGKFSSSAMERTDFSGADLTGSAFKCCDLRGCCFDGADLTDCSFTTLDLEDASFVKTTLVRTDFSKSGLGGAKFSHVKCTDVDFSMVDLRKTLFESCIFDGGQFKYADLRGQDFSGTLFQNVQLGKAALAGASFANARLQNVSFTPPFALTNKYYKVLGTVRFAGAVMDKLTYIALKGLWVDLSGVTVL